VKYFTYYIIYTSQASKILLFNKIISQKIEKPFSKCQRAGNCQAPPIGHVQNFFLGWNYRRIT